METPKVVVTHEHESTNVSLSFRFQENNIDRIFNLQRNKEEDLNSVLLRISSNIEKVMKKKKKKKKKSEDVLSVEKKKKESEDVVSIDKKVMKKEEEKEEKKTNEDVMSVDMNEEKKKKKNEDVMSIDMNEDVMSIDMRRREGGASINKDMSCYECFVAQADLHYLYIGEKAYYLDVNPPIVKTLDLPKNIMAGFPVYPSKVDLLNGIDEDSSFTWYKSDMKFTCEKEAKGHMLKVTWLPMGSGYFRSTENDDVGRLLKVVATPRQGEREGDDAEAVASVLVSAGPGQCPFHWRHEITKHKAGHNCLRVISYNILADQYADSEFARSNLFPTCPTYAIDIDYRKQLLLKEISGYNGDLVCLQEVDEKVFTRDLLPVLRSEGLEGVYAGKGGSVMEGVALFYRLSKLRLLESQRFVLSEELQTNVMFAEMWEQIQCSEDLKEKVVNRFTVLQVSVLESVENPKQVVVVGVTHLYFRPEADHIRLLQAGVGLEILQQVMGLYQNKYPQKEVSLLYAGDFNSTPEFEVYRLMTSQMAGFDDIDWTEKENERVSGVSFSHDMELASACGCPTYTNYVKNFNGCLDYIFYQTDKFTVKQVVDLPSHEEVTQHEFLPSITIPSDHLAIIADLEFKRK